MGFQLFDDPAQPRLVHLRVLVREQPRAVVDRPQERRLFGVLGPSTNTTVQPDYDDMRPPGVTNHYSRIFTPNAKAISNETFIMVTSNIFAIMGLRSLYFLLAGVVDRFHLLKYGLALVLLFIGGKMLAMPWFHMPIQWSLTIVGSIIAVSVMASLALSKPKLNTIAAGEKA